MRLNCMLDEIEIVCAEDRRLKIDNVKVQLVMYSFFHALDAINKKV